MNRNVLFLLFFYSFCSCAQSPWNYDLLDNSFESNDHDIHSILVIQRDSICFEKYLGSHTAEEEHDLRSATKSIIGLLTGIAIDEGKIPGVETSIWDYFPEEAPKDSVAQGIEIRHLLNMNTGWACRDWDRKSPGQEDRIYRKKDWIQEILQLPSENSPGDTSHYCTGSVMVLARILELATGESLDIFANRVLFDPLDIQHYHWGHTSKREVISAGKRLYMRTQDLAKIGLLFLNKGKWGDQRIISQKWIDACAQVHTTITGRGYGFFWWKWDFLSDGQPFFCIAATGNGGQYLLLLPELDAIIVYTGGAFNDPKSKVPLALSAQIVIPLLSQ